VDPAKGNRKILYEVTNRGRKLLAPYLHDAVETGPTGFNDPRSAADAGNALFFRLGFTMVWSGWDPDAPRSASASRRAAAICATSSSSA
jgi:hypothetical protein